LHIPDSITRINIGIGAFEGCTKLRIATRKWLEELEKASKAQSNAKSTTQSSTQTSQNNAETAVDQGNAYYSKQDYDKAIAEYTKAIQLNFNYAYTYHCRGNAYYVKDYDKAIADFTQAIRIDANYKDAYYYRALAYYLKGDHDKEIADWTQVIRLDPKNADA
jgi:tetratricopeptide (TPR) repeat protein